MWDFLKVEALTNNRTYTINTNYVKLFGYFSLNESAREEQLRQYNKHQLCKVLLVTFLSRKVTPAFKALRRLRSRKRARNTFREARENDRDIRDLPLQR